MRINKKIYNNGEMSNHYIFCAGSAEFCYKSLKSCLIESYGSGINVYDKIISHRDNNRIILDYYLDSTDDFPVKSIEWEMIESKNV